MKKRKYPSLIKRTIAYLLDILIINVIIILPFNKILESYTNIKINGFFTFQQDFTLTISIFIILTLSLVYFSVLEYKTRQTIGKMIVGLYVYTKNPNFNKFLIRNITKPFILFLILDTIYLLIKRTNQRFTEKLSQTEVKEL